MVTQSVGCKITSTQTHFKLRKHFHTHIFTNTLHTQKTFPYTHIHKHFTLRKMITAHLLQSSQYNPKDHLPRLEKEAVRYDEVRLVRIVVQVKSQRLLIIKARWLTLRRSFCLLSTVAENQRPKGSATSDGTGTCTQ